MRMVGEKSWATKNEEDHYIRSCPFVHSKMFDIEKSTNGLRAEALHRIYDKNGILVGTFVIIPSFRLRAV
jgi:hypothetical protein